MGSKKMTKTDKLMVERVAKTIWQSLQDFAVKQGVVVSGFPDNAWTAYITIAEDVLRAIDSSKHTDTKCDHDFNQHRVCDKCGYGPIKDEN